MLINIRRQPLSGYYVGSLLFTFQRIWIVLRRCLFLRSVQTFSRFLNSNCSDSGHAESGAKKRVILRREITEVEWENGVWTKICLLANGYLFSCVNFTLILLYFWIGFFLNGFRNPFIVHSSPSFLLEPNFSFSLVVFCSHVAFWQWFSVFFLNFFHLIFLGMVFPTYSEPVFCLVYKNSLNCTSGFVLLCFFISLYLLITFFVLHKSGFSRSTSGF